MKKKRPGQKNDDKKCVLCRKPANVLGFFIPHDPTEFGGSKGKPRKFRYFLCFNCSFDVQSATKVENLIRQKHNKKTA